MSSQISAVYPMIPAFGSLALFDELGVGEPWIFIFVVGVYALGSAAWIYSPLPNNNGGFGAPPARWQKWGWTSEPAGDDYKPFDEYDYNPFLSWRPGALGIFWAEKQDAEADRE